jgi:hypothetical protein
MPFAPKRQLTPLELAARRRNAQKSTGPRTAAGKFRSSLNSLEHELCPFVRERMIEFWGEDVREYRRLHRDLINLFPPEHPYLAERVAELAEAWWEKVCALRAPAWRGFREERVRKAEERIEGELALLIQALRGQSRKWRYRLECDLGATFNSDAQLRERIEARLPVLLRAVEATTIASYAATSRGLTGSLYSTQSKAGIPLKSKHLHKMSTRNEPKAVIPAGISKIGVKNGLISGNIRSLRSDVCSPKS